MRAVDSSVVVAAFATWHDKHEVSRRALDGGLRLVEHCALEAYSVLTRLPPPHRVSGAVVRDFLRTSFPEPFLRLAPASFRSFVVALPEQGVRGGAAYDALVAATAADHGAELVSCDHRAASIYQRYGLRIQLL